MYLWPNLPFHRVCVCGGIQLERIGVPFEEGTGPCPCFHVCLVGLEADYIRTYLQVQASATNYSRLVDALIACTPSLKELLAPFLPSIGNSTAIKH